jgi:lysozyme
MANNNKILWIAAGIAGLLLIPGIASASSSSYQSILTPFIIGWEDFRAHPYWDVSRYSWGYGTKAPGPTGTITEQQAMQELLTHVQNDYDYLKRLITVDLNASQWAALLSFSYNLGPGNADNLVDNINNKNWQALQNRWVQYINVNGVPNSDLLRRRNEELDLFFS